MAVKVSYLVVDIVIVSLQLTVIICNGFILFLHKEKQGHHYQHIFSALPYTIYLTCNWNPVYLDLSPYYVMISSTPLTVQLKINLCLTISIAVERTLALFFPIIFRKLSSRTYAIFSLFVGFLLAVLDVVVEFLLSPFNSVPNCATIGCFLSDSFRYYWGISNMLMGIVVIVLITSILTKLRTLRQQPHPHGTANRSSVGILIISLVFVTLPSVGAGLVEITGFSIFTSVGPFYIVGLLSKGCLAGRRLSTVTTVSTIKAFSTGGR
ncbi:unnamed protein product [Angiostrongylus costaricensis]|uniref:G_PROTEIN_RECEP_F1_2 domain-containing protein n=1 Tax=Angiostrongylus costaricensis TaxID=334426 RepID=A0A0R3PBN4_ANGCS|nr:unnamed protein product [Angiostrongylus costaricensis]